MPIAIRGSKKCHLLPFYSPLPVKNNCSVVLPRHGDGPWMPVFPYSSANRIFLLQCAVCRSMSQTQNSLFKNYTLCSDLPSCFTQGQVSHALVKVMLCSMFCNRNSSSCFYSGLIGFLRNSKSW